MTAPSSVRFDALIAWASVLIEFAGAIVIVAACLRAIAVIVKTLGTRSGVIAARLSIAEGVVAALGLKMAATLLKTLELRSWNAICLFAAIFVLRTFIKTALAWEAVHLHTDAGPSSPKAQSNDVRSIAPRT